MLLSAIAVALGIGPGWSVFWSPKTVEYDPTIAVLTATLVALIWTAYYTYRVVKRSEFEFERSEGKRERARLALLVSVAAELGNIKMSLDVLASGSTAVSANRFLATPVLSQAMTRADLLTANDLHTLTLISNSLLSVSSAHDLINSPQVRLTLSDEDLSAALASNRSVCDSLKRSIDQYVLNTDAMVSLSGVSLPQG